MADDNLRGTNIKKCTYFYDDGIINIIDFNPKNKNRWKTYKDYTEYKLLYDAKPLYLVFSKLNGCIENHVENKSYVRYKWGKNKEILKSMQKC